MHDPSDQWPGLELLLQMMEEAGFAIEDALSAIRDFDREFEYGLRTFVSGCHATLPQTGRP